eukprot:scaffold75920_cov54-Attheya_sp.AAC.4
MIAWCSFRRNGRRDANDLFSLSRADHWRQRQRIKCNTLVSIGSLGGWGSLQVESTLIITLEAKEKKKTTSIL